MQSHWEWFWGSKRPPKITAVLCPYESPIFAKQPLSKASKKAKMPPLPVVKNSRDAGGDSQEV